MAEAVAELISRQTANLKLVEKESTSQEESLPNEKIESSDRSLKAFCRISDFIKRNKDIGVSFVPCALGLLPFAVDPNSVSPDVYEVVRFLPKAAISLTGGILAKEASLLSSRIKKLQEIKEKGRIGEGTVGTVDFVAGAALGAMGAEAVSHVSELAVSQNTASKIVGIGAVGDDLLAPIAVGIKRLKNFFEK